MFNNQDIALLCYLYVIFAYVMLCHTTDRHLQHLTDTETLGILVARSVEHHNNSTKVVQYTTHIRIECTVLRT